MLAGIGVRRKGAVRIGLDARRGMAVHGLPDLLVLYGPQSTAAFCNGPVCAEIEGEWVTDLLGHHCENDRGAPGPRALPLGRHRRDGGRMGGTDIGMILDVTPGDHEGFERHLLEGMGHEVEVCHGPGGHNRCPIIEEGTCELVDRAHGVVFKLDLDREYHRRILETYRRVIGGVTPIAVAVQPGQDVTYADLLEGCYLWTHQPTAAELDGFAALVEAADRDR